MNTSRLMDKQIMDLSRAKPDDQTTTNKTNDLSDLILTHHHHHNRSDDEIDVRLSPPLDLDNNNNDILPSYNFQPISNSAPRVSDFKPYSAPLKSYGSVDSAKPSELIQEKAQKANDSAILSKIDQALKKHTDSIFHAMDSLSARLSKLEKTTHDLEYSVDDLKVSVVNSNGISDGKMRQLENMLIEVQTGVEYIKDKQDVMEGYVQLAKLQTSKVEKTSQVPNTTHVGEPIQPSALSAPQQQSNVPQFPNPIPHPPPSLPPSLPQQNIHPLPSGTTQFPPVQMPTGFAPPGQTPELPSQQFQPVPSQHQPPVSIPAPLPQQHQSASMPPYPQPPQQQLPQFVPPHPEETPFMPPQTYSQNVCQPVLQPSGGPHQTPQYYSSPPAMYEPPPSGRSSSGFREPYPYGGPVSHYGSGSTTNPHPHSPRGGGNNYPQIPTARIVPQAIPSATPVGSGSSTGSGGGNRVPVDDLVDKVATMGFPRDHVRATIRRLTEDGQSVDLNIVLDKLMNDGDVPPPKGWFGR